jgi:hypothetical protein
MDIAGKDGGITKKGSVALEIDSGKVPTIRKGRSG